MRIIGLDAAADLKKFGYIVCAYENDALSLLSKGVLAEDATIDALASEIGACATQTLIAIDAPLGWPAAMGDQLPGHCAGGFIPSDADMLFRRETDRWVHQVWKKRSLDVGADKIARATARALQVLHRLRAASGQPIPLVWQPDFGDRVGVIEVYPAATLVANQLASTGYKDLRRDVGVRQALAWHFQALAPWLIDLGSEQVDIFDAGLCAIAGADFLTGAASPPEDLALAKKEGWIWVRAPGAGGGRNAANQIGEHG